MQKLKIKMQNEKEKFKKDFIKRMINFSIKVVALSENIGRKRINWPIAQQLIRSATSIGANVVEAQASSSKRDFIKFFEIALKSANETKYWLIIVKEIMPGLKNQARNLLGEVNEIAKVIGSSILTLKGKK